MVVVRRRQRAQDAHLAGVGLEAVLRELLSSLASQICEARSNGEVQTCNFSVLIAVDISSTFYNNYYPLQRLTDNTPTRHATLHPRQTPSACCVG